MHDTTTTTTAPAKLTGFSTAKTQQNGSLVTLARCDWGALHNGDNALPVNPTAIATFMQRNASEGVAVVAWLQGPAVIINGHDSKAATVALLAVVNAYRAALTMAAEAEAETARQAAEAARLAAEAEAAEAEAPSKRSRNGRGR